MSPISGRKHEVAFCADVKSWADAIFAQHKELPFLRAGIEGYGYGSQRRQDLRFFDRAGNVVLCGEVKLPRKTEKRSPYDAAEVNNAYEKADNLQCRYFFTWNVNVFVLWDRQQWDVPMLERRVRSWKLDVPVQTPEDLRRPDVARALRDRFLPKLFSDFADIYAGRTTDWGIPPDDVFLQSLESHLDWPVSLTRDWLLEECARSKAFSSRFEEWMAKDQQWSFVRKDSNAWAKILERAARSICYVLSNKVIFFEAIRARFRGISELKLPNTHDCGRLYKSLQKRFQEAIRLTGDYEPIFYPQERDWVGPLVFSAPGSLDAWRAFLRNIEGYNFRTIPRDILGGIFQRLISPEERRKHGQFYTNEDIVDVMNAFCIRRPSDKVLDPACGSGSFLVRAYHRKAWMDPTRSHQALLSEIYGCDIALFAAHLTTLNLAARHIQDEANYPLVVRKNFFDIEKHKPFCQVPAGVVSDTSRGRPELQPVPVPEFDAIVGNPPYVRQELIPRKRRKGIPTTQTKEYLQHLVETAWPGLKLGGRSDLHLYFWPAATRFLKEGGYFGFLTSSSWLDVEYGFALQKWILRNFKLVAVIESTDEPWFEDARIKTCVTVLQRCSDEAKRTGNLVKFVQVKKPLRDVLGGAHAGDEGKRQSEVESFRSVVEQTKKDYSTDEIRIIVKPQQDLWGEGVSPETKGKVPEVYVGGKWGRYLRAPDFYFEIMRQFGHRFVRLGNIVEIRFGVKSGCDAFFMPHDVTAKMLEEYPNAMSWNRAPFFTRCKRREVEKGVVKVLRAGDGSIHPVEAKYLEPEVHSLMQIDRPVVTAADCDRVVLQIGKPKGKLRGTYVLKYINYGEHSTFGGSVPVHKRSTCAARSLWYDLTDHKRGFAFWPMAQQYRHIVAANPESLICNHNLFDLFAGRRHRVLLTAVLNSSLVAMFKTFYGRYAGTEGNLKTEVVDVRMIEVPSTEKTEKNVAKQLANAVSRMQKRVSGPMVESKIMACRSPEQASVLLSEAVKFPQEFREPDRRLLDDAVFQLLGVNSPSRRRALLRELYTTLTLHYRKIRALEIQKQQQRRKSKAPRFSAEDLANDIWDTLEGEKSKLLVELLAQQQGSKTAVAIPETPAKLNAENHMFENNVVRFGKGGKIFEVYPHRPTAELVAELSNAGITGTVEIPESADDCRRTLKELRKRLADAKAHFEELASSRTGTDKLREAVVEILMRWSCLGRPQ